MLWVKAVSGTSSGIYYLWNTEGIHRIYKTDNATSRVGVDGQVTGYIEKKYIV